MTIEDAIMYLIQRYKEAKKNRAIHKPISWALYKTWVYVDSCEKEK